MNVQAQSNSDGYGCGVLFHEVNPRVQVEHVTEEVTGMISFRRK